MSNKNIKAACSSAGLLTPCPGDFGCSYTNITDGCVPSKTFECGTPIINIISSYLCGTYPNQCATLNNPGTFAYMGKVWGGDKSAGVVKYTYWVYGTSYYGFNAICAAYTLIDTFTVPSGVTSITILAKGAQGGATAGGVGGKGASIQGTFSVTAGQVLSILVGGQGGSEYSPGGGGGSFVALGSIYSLSTPLLVAGGGGGGYGSGNVGQGGLTTQLGGGPVVGSAGNGAPSTLCGGGGGGFYSSGGSDTTPYIWQSDDSTHFQQIGYGGIGFRKGGDKIDNGQGFGVGGVGGGSTANDYYPCNMYAGSGGGYTGGSGTNTYTLQYSGYGGGSFNGGSNQTNIAAQNPGSGMVMITDSNSHSTLYYKQVTPIPTSSPTALPTAFPSNPTPIPTSSPTNPTVIPTSSIPTPKPSRPPTIAPTFIYNTQSSSTTFLTTIDNWKYYSVPVNGAMTSNNINAACASAGLLAPCTSDFLGGPLSNCVFTMWGLGGYGDPFQLLSRLSNQVCGTDPYHCPVIASPGTFLISPQAILGNSFLSYLNQNSYYGYNTICAGSIFVETFTVPSGVTSITILAKGAQGGATAGGVGGMGASIQGTFSVTAGQVLSILVGGQGGSGRYPGGGGGSFVALGSSFSLYDSIGRRSCGGVGREWSTFNLVWRWRGRILFFRGI